MSNLNSAKEKPAEILKTEQLFLEYAKPENEPKRLKIVKEIQANLDRAEANGVDVELYWDAFDELDRNVDEIEHPEEVAMLKAEIRRQIEKK